ncbi:MAG: cupin domain-containing protein [Candidatus Limnocylindrales bacterium]|jgi:quercetin dioxygenase-like cupin family protein
MEIRRFGIGHRRDDGPPGTRGVEATSIHADGRGVVAELSLKPNAAIAPHSNPNLAYLLVIEGGGFVQVGDERARVAAGDAVVWPPDVVHAAWTELTPMRAIVVEFAPEPGLTAPSLLEGGSVELAATEASAEPARADGALRPKPAVLPPDRESPEREPW